MARQSKISAMSIEALINLRDEVTTALSRKADQLKGQLARLAGGNGFHTGTSKPGKLKGRKVAPKYRSRKNPKLTWAGRGATPLWMREEMKGTKLKKDNFLIK
ncbi:MAG: H-NS family nucleoid-associated regulatory protein [Xanthobacteraceae bacterium]